MKNFKNFLKQSVVKIFVDFTSTYFKNSADVKLTKKIKIKSVGKRQANIFGSKLNIKNWLMSQGWLIADIIDEWPELAG